MTGRTNEAAATDDAYREQAEALIADLRARVSHYEARIAAQMDDEVSEDDLRAFIVDAVRANDSLPQALRKTYRITLRYPSAHPSPEPPTGDGGREGVGRRG